MQLNRQSYAPFHANIHRVLTKSRIQVCGKESLLPAKRMALSASDFFLI